MTAVRATVRTTVRATVRETVHGGGSGGGGDPDFASVTALLHFDGADASTTFTDVTGKAWTPANQAQIDTAESKFGGASGLFDGTEDYLSTPSHAGFDLAASSFTIEAWIRPAIVNRIQGIASRRANSAWLGWVFWVKDTAKLGLAFASTVDGVAWADFVSTTSIVANVWTHVAVTFDGTTLRLFINGTLDASTTSFTGTRRDATTAALIGRDRDGSTLRDWQGHIDDLRITKGVARYTANFTPPSAAFPNS